MEVRVVVRRNLFIGITNDKLKKCYESYIRVQCKRGENIELFSELSLEYETIVGKKASMAICASDMLHEIARRFFIAYKGFGELLG